MMQHIGVSAASLNQTPFDFEGNTRRIVEALTQARAQHSSVLCLPELCITGYGCEDVFLMPWLYTRALEQLNILLPHTMGITAAVGLPLMHEGLRYNGVCVLSDGEIVAFIPKQHLANTGIHYEHRWFTPWPQGHISTFHFNGRAYPVGDFVCNIGGVRIGFEICEDAWVSQRPGASLALRGADLILSPSASHCAFGKYAQREKIVQQGSKEYAVGYVYANAMGNESGRAIYDGGNMVAALGTVLHKGVRFSYRDVEVTTAWLDLSAIRQAHTQAFPQMSVTHEVHKPFTYPAVSHPAVFTTEAPCVWEHSFHLKEEEFTRAVCLGLYDYMRKSRSHGFVLSLSGGCDSATLAVLCKTMISLGIQSCGYDTFVHKINHIPGIEKHTPHTLVQALLTCVYQSTRNSSRTTEEAARGVAQGVGSVFHVFNIDGIVEQHTQHVEQALGVPVTWQNADIALQNVQARSRSPGVWMLANIQKALLLSTSNRSEAAVGYATMDGDTSGGLSPIAGIDKPFLRHYLLWLEHTGGDNIPSMPFLAAVNRQQPTAELRPLGHSQTDEKDLMPYDVLNTIEEAFVQQHIDPALIPQHLHEQFPQHDVNTCTQWCTRFLRLWQTNQWKRERYAPSFHLDTYSLDPKTHMRFPILSASL